ncbi:MAG: PaaI family thioesterase [Rhodospirillales bacterium]|nr:PaaI family thioesterase [Rhodospirillales bacterium]QQS13280.1 MAG: PaaI family thioesterase [Rhodospirillales bacterium]
MPIQRPADAEPVEYRFVGFNAYIGHRVVAWRPGFVEVELKVRPELCNAGGILHGGVLMTLLDSASGVASTFDERTGKRHWTVTMSFTTQFLKSARDGDTLTILGLRREGGGRSTFTTEAEIRDQHGDLVACGTGTFRQTSRERDDGSLRRLKQAAE